MRLCGPGSLVLLALVDPAAALRRAAEAPPPWRVAGWIGGLSLALGLATLPRQLPALAATMPPLGDPRLDAQTAALRDALTRLIVADRVVPSPTVLLAALLLVLAAEPVLMLAREGRAAIVTVVLLGLAPLLVERVGELLMVYLTPAAELGTPGAVVELPHRFVTGPKLLAAGGEVPGWLELLEARVNLVSLWCVALWAVGLRRLADGRLEAWHVALPLACLAGAAVGTWALGPLAVQMVMR